MLRTVALLLLCLEHCGAFKGVFYHGPRNAPMSHCGSRRRVAITAATAGDGDGGSESPMSRRAALNLLFPIGVIVGANLPFIALMANPPSEAEIDAEKAVS